MYLAPPPLTSRDGGARAPRKPPPRPGGFGFQRARCGNVAGRTMTIPVYGGNQGNGIGHAAAVHTRNSHRARTHMSDTLMSVYKCTHAHTRVRTRPPSSCNIIIIVIILDDDDNNNIKLSNARKSVAVDVRKSFKSLPRKRVWLWPNVRG